MTVLVEDLTKAVLVALVAIGVLLRVWGTFDHRSPGAAWVRRFWSIRLVSSVLAVTVFAAVAEDVLMGEGDELILYLDRWLREIARHLAEMPAVRGVARLLSHATGEGLVVALFATVAALFVARRQREARVVVLGTLGAWMLSGLLKVAFAIPRPRAHWPWQIFSSYGFPSGHTLVTLVALGLIAWATGRGASSFTRVSLGTGAVVVAGVSGCSRLVLDAHWLSDVIGGLALGIVWLNVSVAFAERQLGETSGRSVVALSVPAEAEPLGTAAPPARR